MNKIYENPEAKVVYFQANEKLALIEDDGGIQSRGLINSSSKIEQDKD